MHDSLDDWVDQAKLGRIGWSELAERILRLEHSPGQPHQPDVDRARRCGLPEVIFGSGKSAAAIAEIANHLLDAGQSEILVTRVEPDKLSELSRRVPFLRYDSLGRTLRLSRTRFGTNAPVPATNPTNDVAHVSVVCAGSTDLPVAREALETLAWMGIQSTLVCDVGVAGPYRLLSRIDLLRQSVAIVVIAGMEGALASVLGGLVSCPVIAVPTSIGYGANLGGITTLLSMLSSCAANVTVVNIDSGFKGAYIAGLIARQVNRRSE